MTEKKTPGGLRNPPGGRPRKDNVVLHCHVSKETLAAIDTHRGKLTRGDYITMLIAGDAIRRSNET